MNHLMSRLKATGSRPDLASMDFDPDYLLKWLLVIHQITQEEYNYRQQLFFLPSQPPTEIVTISMSDLSAYVNNLSCGFENVVFNVDFDDKTTNNEIHLLNRPVQPQPDPTNIIAFSTYFFRAICQVYGESVTQIEVTKVVSPFGDNFGRSVAFRLVDLRGNVYCSDLSGVYP